MGNPVELATAYVALVPSAKGIAASAAAELGAPLEAAALTSGTAASKGFASSFSNGLGGLKKVFTAALPAAAVAATGGALFKLGESFDAVADRIRVDTGATGAALAGLTDDFKAVAKLRPDSLDNIGQAVSTLNQRLGLAGKPLQQIAAQVLELSEITKTDLATNLDSVTTLMNSFSVAADAQGAKLDELFRASQATGVSVSDLAAAMASGGSVLRQVGLDFEQSAALLGLLRKVGVEATSVMAPLSKSIATAAKQGKGASDVLSEVFERIRLAPNDTAAAGVAIDVFGAKAGPKLAGLIREGKLAYQDLATQIANGSDTIASATADTEDFAEKWGILKNKVKVALAPLAARTFDGVTEAIDAVTPKVDTAIASASRLGGIVSESIGAAFDRIRSVHVDEIFANITAKVDVATEAFKRHRDVLLPTVAALGSFVTTLVALNHAQSAVAGVSSTLKLLGPALSGALAPLIANPIGLLVAGIVAIGAAFVVAYLKVKPFHDAVDAVVDFVRTKAVAAFDALQPALAALGDALATTGGFFATLGKGATSGVKAAQRALAPLAKWFNDNVLSTFIAAVDFLDALFERIGNVVQLALVPVRQSLADIRSLIDAAFGPAAAIVGGALNQITDSIKAFVKIAAPILETAFDGVRVVVETVFGAIEAVIDSTLGIIRGLFEVGAGILRGDFSKIWEGLVDIVSAPFSAVETFIDDTLFRILGFFQTFPSKLASVAAGMWGFIEDSFKNMLNGIIDLWNTLKIPSFTIGGWDTPFGELPGWDTPEINFPDIPRLALGGIVTKPLLALIGEGQEPEVVAPLSDLRGMLLDVNRTAANAAMPAAARSDSGVHIDRVNVYGADAPKALAHLPAVLRQSVTLARR